jgi:hypothetical protein
VSKTSGSSQRLLVHVKIRLQTLSNWLKSLGAVTVLLGFLFAGSPASAAYLQFTDFNHLGSDAVDYIVVIEDDSEEGVTEGSFRISYQVDPSSTYSTGKLTGMFIDFIDPFAPGDGPYTTENLNLSNETIMSCGQGFNTLSVSGGKGCNTNLTMGADADAYKKHDWDLAIAWKNNDLTDGVVQSFEFNALEMTLGDIAAIGLRGQATTGPGGSAKEFALAPEVVVPLPGSATLFVSALVGLLIRKSRNTFQ